MSRETPICVGVKRIENSFWKTSQNWLSSRLMSLGDMGCSLAMHQLKEREEFASRINQSPRDYITQPIISLSSAPQPFALRGVEGRHVDLRPFILYGEDIEIVPGG